MSARRVLLLALIMALVLVVGQVAAVGAAPADNLPEYVSAEAPGTTSDGLDYGPEDVLVRASGTWYTYFDGSAVGLASKTHEIDGFSLDQPNDWLYMTFNDNRTVVPGIPGRVFGQDVVAHDMANPGDFYVVFDGSDVGLKGQASRLDALFVMYAESNGFSPYGARDTNFYTNPFGLSCQGEILMSPVGRGRIFGKYTLSGNQIRYSGEDILWFCATNLGAKTTGVFVKYFDGMGDDPDAIYNPAEPMPNRTLNAMTPGSSGPFGGSPVYFMTRGFFDTPNAFGGYNQLFRWAKGSGLFENGYFNADDAGLNGRVTGLHIWPAAPYPAP